MPIRNSRADCSNLNQENAFMWTGLLSTHPCTTFSVPMRNTGKCFERPAKILRGRQRFGDNLGGGGAEEGGGAGVLTIWF